MNNQLNRLLLFLVAIGIGFSIDQSANGQGTEVEADLKASLLSRFDADLAQRRAQIEKLKRKIDSLEKLLAVREARRTDIVKAQLAAVLGKGKKPTRATAGAADETTVFGAIKTAPKKITNSGFSEFEVGGGAANSGFGFSSGMGQPSKPSQSDMNKMKKVLLAIHNHMDATKKFPFSADKTAKSWKVKLLPYIGSNDLVEELARVKKSGNPLKTLPIEPKQYRLSRGTMTFVEPEKIPTGFRDILDGTSNTIVVVQDLRKSPHWTKVHSITPTEFANQVQELMDGDSLLIGFYDGHVETITNKTARSLILNLCMPADGKVTQRARLR